MSGSVRSDRSIVRKKREERVFNSVVIHSPIEDCRKMADFSKWVFFKGPSPGSSTSIWSLYGFLSPCFSKPMFLFFGERYFATAPYV
jgi:hypothetical protein